MALLDWTLYATLLQRLAGPFQSPAKAVSKPGFVIRFTPGGVAVGVNVSTTVDTLETVTVFGISRVVVGYTVVRKVVRGVVAV
jgi:hypothetical protein